MFMATPDTDAGMERRPKLQFLSAALGPNLFIELTEELTAIGEGSSLSFTCIPDVGFEARRYGLSADETVLLVHGLTHDLFRPASAELQRLNDRWPDCVSALLRGYNCVIAA